MQCTTGPAALFACICVGVLFVVSTAQAQPTCTWTDNPIVAGQTPIKAQHINEIRACLDAVIANWPDSPEPPPPPPPPPSGFNAGTWRVGVDVQPGRYFTSPPASCEWARRDATGAAIDTVYGPNLVLSSMLQEIADIKASDYTFQTTCEPWQSTPTASVPAGKIVAGTWLAGEQVTAGTYTTHANEGCYWATLRGFSGAFAEIIDNDFVDFVDSVLNPVQRVTISADIVGFTTDDDCGTWTRIGDATGAVVESGDRSELERNYRKRAER